MERGRKGGEESHEPDDGEVRDDDKYSSEYLVNTIVELAEVVQTLEREQHRVEFKDKDVQVNESYFAPSLPAQVFTITSDRLFFINQQTPLYPAWN